MSGHLRRIGSVTGATLVQTILSLILAVILARSLGPSGRGVYGTVTLLVMMTGALATLGFQTGYVFALARQPAGAPAALSASLIIAVAGGGLATWLVQAAAEGGLLGNVDRHLLALASPAIPAITLTALLSGMLSGLGRVTRAYWLSALGVLFGLICLGAALWRWPGDVKAALSAFTVSSVITAAGATLAVLPRRGPKLGDPRLVWRELGSFSLTSHLASSLHLLHLRIDVFLVNAFLSSEQVGLYVLAQGLCEWIWLVPRAAGAVLLPSVAASSPQLALARTTQTCRLALAVAGGAALLLGVAAGPLIPIVFGASFAGSVTPLRILLPGVWAASVTGILSAYLTGLGKPVYPLANSLVSLALNIGLNLALLPAAGIAGAALASACTYALGAAINVAFVRQQEPLRLRELLPLRGDDYVGAGSALARLLGRRPSARHP